VCSSINPLEPFYFEGLFGIVLGNIAFKVKKSFLAKASFLSFFQKCVWTIFRIKSQRSTFQIFYQTG
jgi:hypothetical protein